MSIATLIIGESGSGKTASLRNFNPESTLLIQALKKPLSFKAKGWGIINNENTKGNIIVSDDHNNIIFLMKKTRRKVILVDDFQYIMANEFMRRNDERGYDKFNDIGRHAWDILNAASQLPDDVRVYLLGHSTTDENGHIKAKTIGKMLDDKITVEGMFTIVLRTVVQGGEYTFATQNSGSDTCKTPMGMFDEMNIPNDLAAVDAAICNYYGINNSQST